MRCTSNPLPMLVGESKQGMVHVMEREVSPPLMPSWLCTWRMLVPSVALAVPVAVSLLLAILPDLPETPSPLDDKRFTTVRWSLDLSVGPPAVIETLHAAAIAGTMVPVGGAVLYVMVPGVPGCGTLYAGLLGRLQEALAPAACEVVALSYDCEGPGGLDREVDVLKTALQRILAESQAVGRRGVVVLAQSMGALLSTAALERLRAETPQLLEEQLLGLHLITPFFDPSTSHRGGRAQRTAASIPPWAASMAFAAVDALVARVPTGWVGRIIMWVQHRRKHVTDVNEEEAMWFFRELAIRFPPALRHSMGLGREAVLGWAGSMHPTGPHKDWVSLLQHLSASARLAVLLAADDGWTSNFDLYFPGIVSAAPELSPPWVRTLPVGHGFPQVPRNCILAAAALAQASRALGWLGEEQASAGYAEQAEQAAGSHARSLH